jgi:hypothetical protein
MKGNCCLPRTEAVVERIEAVPAMRTGIAGGFREPLNKYVRCGLRSLLG